MAGSRRFPRSARLLALTTTALVLTLAGAAPAHAVSTKTATKYYAVSGATLDEIRASMAANTPTGSPGYAWGVINWRFNTTWNSSRTRCSVTRVRVTLAQTYTMPKWARPEGTAQEVADAWNRFLNALWVHERGHGKLSSKAALSIERFLGSVTRRTCRAATSAANSGANARITAQRKQQAAYDVRTDHGATQGATL